MDAQDEGTVEQSPEEKIADMMFGKEAPQDAQDEPEIDDLDEAEEPEELEASEDEEGEEEPEYVEIEIDGEVLQVPPKYKDYFMRQQDYTQKTQEVAAERKTVEAIQAQVQAEQAKYQFLESVQDEMQQAESLKAQIDQVRQYKREQIDNLDAKDLFKIDAQIEEWQTSLNAIGQSLNTKQQEFQQAQQQSLQELLDKSTEALRSRIPNWGEQTQKQVRDFALSNGFTEQELNSVYDPRYVEVLWKASQYDTLKKGAAVAVKKVQDAPTIKAKARKRQMDPITAKKLNTRKVIKSANKSDADKARAAGDYLADRFGF